MTPPREAGRLPERLVVGWGDGLTGPTTRGLVNTFCGGPEWPNVPISVGHATIALVPAQEDGDTRQPLAGSEQEIAAELVRRWNSHAALVAALEEVEALLEGHEDGAPDASRLSKLANRACAQARAALSAAKGETR